MRRAFAQVFVALQLFTVSIFTFSPLNTHATAMGNDPISEIAGAFKSANVAEIIKYVDNSIDISITGTDVTYNKTTAEKALKDFFAQNAPQNFTLKHQGASKDGAKYAVGNLSAGGKSYRVHFVLKQTGTEMHLQSIEIMKE